MNSIKHTAEIIGYFWRPKRNTNMLQLQNLRDNTKAVLAGLAKRNLKEAEEWVNKALELDKQKRAIQTDTQERETKLNADSKKLGS